MSNTFDSIVIGAGGFGSGALYHLARRGGSGGRDGRVLGIERFGIGHDRGSSHGQTRIIRQAYFEHPAYVPLLVRAYELWRDLEQESGRSLMHLCGLMLAGPPDGEAIPGAKLAAGRHGLAIEDVAPGERRGRFPGFRIPAGFDVVYEANAGYLRVEECVRAHLERAVARGALLKTGETVIAWESDGRSVSVRTDRDEYQANRLVIAAGAWAAALCRMPVPLRVVRKPQFWHAVASADYDETAGGPAFLFELPAGTFYGFPSLDGHFVKVAEHTGGIEVADALTVDRDVHESDVRPVADFLRQALPGVNPAPARHSVCLYTHSPDGHFLVDRHPDYENVVIAAGFSGHGFKFTGVLGEALAELALEGRTRHPIEFLSLGRFPGRAPAHESSSAGSSPAARTGARIHEDLTTMKTPDRILFVFGCLLCGPLVAGVAPTYAAQSRPNIVFVLIDDMGWGDLSCFGNQAVRTENIDRLATEGMRFEQFYVNSPICSPSRTAVSTGQYSQRWRITSFLNNRTNNEDRGMAQWLDPQAPMLARCLQQAGYATGHFGKWHMGGQRDVGEAPLITEYGFDESLTNFEGLGDRVLPLCDAFDRRPPRKHALGSDLLGRGQITWEDRSQVTAAFVSAAVDFIRRAEADDQPFYVNLWPDDVHSPFFPPRERRGDGTKRALYHGVLDTMDEQLGVLFDYIRASDELRSNTLILVCSDNGPERGAGSAGPFRGFKTMLYEGGVRSPLIVWGPGLIEPDRAGTVNARSFFAAIDLVPSLLSLTGTQLPPGIAFDGVPLPDVLLGRADASRDEPLFFRRPPDRDDFFGVDDLPDLAVRDGPWKLLCEYDGADVELYHLDADRAETINVAAQQPHIVRRLRDALLAWHQSLPPDNGATYGLPEKGTGSRLRRLQLPVVTRSRVPVPFSDSRSQQQKRKPQ